MSYLDNETFKTIVENTPLFSIDLVVMNDNQEILMGYRKNPPAQGHWFVPGGRVFKNEHLNDAFRRISRTELNLEYCMENATPLGLYDHFYSDSIFGMKISTHYINTPYLIHNPNLPDALPHSQHKEYRWVAVDDLEQDTSIHKYARIFLPMLRASLSISGKVAPAPNE